MTEKPQDSSNRIAKVIARSGVCSRREAEKLIEAGRVTLDGKVVTSPAINVAENSKIAVDGKEIGSKQTARLWIFHKPKGVITSNGDPQGRTTVFDILPKNMPRVISIGRLDYNTEGLLLLTTSGALARHMELPSTGLIRTYKVRVYGAVDEKKLDIIRKGAVVDGVQYAPAKIKVETLNRTNSWLIFSISEGKNLEVRKTLAHIGLEVNRLIRVSYGPFKLGTIPSGKVVEIAADMIEEKIGKGF